MPDEVAVEIAGSVGGLSIGAIAVLAIFAQEHLWIAAPFVVSLSVLGIALANFDYKKKLKEE